MLESKQMEQKTQEELQTVRTQLGQLGSEALEDVTKIEQQLREEFVAVTVRCDKLSREQQDEAAQLEAVRLQLQNDTAERQVRIS